MASTRCCVVRAADAARRGDSFAQRPADRRRPRPRRLFGDAARVRDLDEALAGWRGLQQRGACRRAPAIYYDARRLPVPDERARDLERVCQTLGVAARGRVRVVATTSRPRYGMWDVCLATLKVCGHDDEPLAVKLWTSLIKRLVPNNARDPELRRELTSARPSGSCRAARTRRSRFGGRLR